jgi:hypothetical protein
LLLASVDNWNPKGSAIAIFNRTDNGNVKPKAVIAGPNTGLRGLQEQVLVYPPKGLVFTILAGEDRNARGTEISVWNVDDNGDVPPRFVLGGTNGKDAMLGRRFTLVPTAKEIIVGRGTIVQMFSFPEVF